MINEVTVKNTLEHNPNWAQNPDYSYRILSVNVKYDIKRVTAKISTLSSGKIDNYGNLKVKKYYRCSSIE